MFTFREKLYTIKIHTQKKNERGINDENINVNMGISTKNCGRNR